MNIEHHSSNSHNVLKIAEKYKQQKMSEDLWRIYIHTLLIISFYSILGKFQAIGSEAWNVDFTYSVFR